MLILQTFELFYPSSFFVDSLEYFMVKMISVNDANDFLLLPFQVGCLFFFFHLKNLSVCACVCLGAW